MKIVLLFVSLCSVLLVQAQATISQVEIEDTLLLHHHIGGEMDSVDLFFAEHSTTRPGGGIGHRENVLPSDFFYNSIGGTYFSQFSPWKTLRFSALPHLGFAYVFGSQGTQNLNTNYLHQFNKNTALLVDYQFRKGEGFIRNNTFNNHDVQMQLDHRGDLYSFNLKGQYLKKTWGESNGVTTDTLLEEFPLALIPVNKTNASTEYGGARVNYAHVLDFLKNDTINAVGIYAEHKLRVSNRIYSEEDTLFGLYPTIYFDSSTTRDVFQLNEFINEAGFYGNYSSLYIKGGLLANSWSYLMRNQSINQVEINAQGELNAKWNTLKIYSFLDYNISGANNEWLSNSTLRWKKEKLHVGGQVELGERMPEQFQRYYFGNTFYHDNAAMEKIGKLKVAANTDYAFNSHLKIGFNARYTSLSNFYSVENNTWETSSINHLSIQARIKAIAGPLHADVKAEFLNGKYVPDYLIQTRLMLQGRLFKKKKLLAQIGVEGSAHSKYELLDYVPVMDAYAFPVSNGSSNMQFGTGRYNLHAFGAFEIDQFRFFFRVENIGYVWNDSKIMLLRNYPMQAMQIRVGITWDFFN